MEADIIPKRMVYLKVRIGSWCTDVKFALKKILRKVMIKRFMLT